MDKHKHSHCSKRVLPNTPRVSDKTKEYYQKFGHNRDIEKFMRLYSPASSQDSQKTQQDCSSAVGAPQADYCCVRTCSHETISSSGSICEALAMMPSRPLIVANSKSLPNIDVQGHDVLLTGSFPPKEVIVDINIELEDDKEKIISISTENIQTPKKTIREIKTQTPDSVAKSHRRLEWDSLGDVGYKKSMSTSNISILERSLLKEFFKENSVNSEPCTSQQAKEIEIQKKQIEQKIIKCIKTTEIEHSTPPLASSTLVENSTKRGAKPKMISHSTSATSLQEKFDKYAQTSLLKPPNVHSQEIQCTLSSSNSIVEGTTTPSSFEYNSSRSSKSSEYIIESSSRRQNKSTEHPFISSITELLMKRKVLHEKNQQKRQQLDNIRELQIKFQAALEDNKENQSHSTTTVSSTTSSNATSSFSLTKQAPELDLGIQLICSLIDAKSVNAKQKKQLIRDIVKRITRLEASEASQSTNSSSGAITNSNENRVLKNHNIYDSVHSNRSVTLPEEQLLSRVLSDMLVHSELGISPITSTVNKQVPMEKSSTSTSNTSEMLKSNRVSNPLKEGMELKRQKEEHQLKFQAQQEKKSHDKHFPCKTTQYENVLKENNKKVSNLTPVAGHKEKQIDLIKKQQLKAVMANKISTSSIENKTSKSTQTFKATINSGSINKKTSSNKSSSSSSPTTTQDLTTQKFVDARKELNTSNTDAEQPTMREWLNPLTQSEIEYEEKKRQEIKNKTTVDLKRDKQLKKSSIKHDCGRVKQLNWIENEIHRLECLKHLLLKDEIQNDVNSSTTLSSIEWTSHKENLNKDSTQTDKLYDTVYSDKSSVLSESAERLVKEIEIILEESNEDVINLKDNLKRTKERKKETQIVYEKPKETHAREETFKNKPKFRTIKETITINEEQLLTDKDLEMQLQPEKQREKMNTPSTENSPESESLKHMVQQRKREFMEAYKTKKQTHYEALKQQQKEEFKYLNLQRKSNIKPTKILDSNHYSVPHTISRKFPTLGLSYAQNPLPSSPEETETKTKSDSSAPNHIIYSTSASFQQTNGQQSSQQKENSSAKTNTTTTTTTTTSSSSSTSMFCISSDVSVPMGSQLTMSTPTTTHQYDDVAAAVAGVAVQTSDSLLRSKPIYGPKIKTSLQAKRSTTCLRPFTPTTTACIQVKPKGIAYVIEFDDNKNSNSNINLNSDDLKSKFNMNPFESAETNNTNNNKAFIAPSEPQMSLQEYLEKSKPKFLLHSKERKAIINQLQSMRQERDRKLREIVDNTSFNSLEKRLENLTPPPKQNVRIFNTKKMKALTNKRFARLPEVVAKKERELEEKKRRSYRILRDVFNRRLQKRVRDGNLNFD